MRTYAPAAVAALASLAAACGYDLTTREIQSSTRAVITYHSAALAFPAGTSFAIVDRLGVVTDDPAAAATLDAPTVVAQVAADLAGLGFVDAGRIDPAAPPTSPVAADLAVNLTALDATSGTGPYWTASAGHLGPGTFGYAGYAWAYPLAWLDYQAAPGTLLVEIGDLRSPTGNEIPVVWVAEIRAAGAKGYETASVLDGLRQAVLQSPYLRPGGAP